MRKSGFFVSVLLLLPLLLVLPDMPAAFVNHNSRPVKHRRIQEFSSNRPIALDSPQDEFAPIK
jgi:hypothetical protein